MSSRHPLDEADWNRAKCVLHRSLVEHKSAWFDDRLASNGNECDATHSLRNATRAIKRRCARKEPLADNSAGLIYSKPKCLLFTSRSHSSLRTSPVPRILTRLTTSCPKRSKWTCRCTRSPPARLLTSSPNQTPKRLQGMILSAAPP